MLGASKAGLLGAAAGGGSDPYFANVSLLLHADGADASTTFTDSSSNGLTVTALISAQIDTAQFKFGGASGLFSGSGDGLTVANNAVFAMGSGDFTLEAFARFSSLPSSGNYNIFIAKGNFSGSQRSYIWGIYNDAGSYKMFLGYTTTGTSFTLTYSTAISLSTNTWYHFALSVESTTGRYFADGVQYGSVTLSGALFAGTDDLYIATRDASTTQDFLGWLDELRITKGVARYTTGFTPPSAAFPNS
jgi:hypothetical protein